MHTSAKTCAFFIGFAVDNIGETGVRSKESIGERMMRIIKKWIGRKPETAGEVRLLEVSQGEMFEQMYPLLGQLALHATSGRDVDYRLYFICEGGRRILPVDRPSVMSGAFNNGVNPLVMIYYILKRFNRSFKSLQLVSTLKMCTYSVTT